MIDRRSFLGRGAPRRHCPDRRIRFEAKRRPVRCPLPVMIIAFPSSRKAPACSFKGIPLPT